MEHLKLRRDVQLKYWIDTLEEIIQEFPGSNMNIDTAIKSFKSQLKELENKR
jgi:hypothetical protein